MFTAALKCGCSFSIYLFQFERYIPILREKLKKGNSHKIEQMAAMLEMGCFDDHRRSSPMKTSYLNRVLLFALAYHCKHLGEVLILHDMIWMKMLTGL